MEVPLYISLLIKQLVLLFFMYGHCSNHTHALHYLTVYIFTFFAGLVQIEMKSDTFTVSLFTRVTLLLGLITSCVSQFGMFSRIYKAINCIQFSQSYFAYTSHINISTR